MVLVPAVQRRESAVGIHLPLCFGFPSRFGHHRVCRAEIDTDVESRSLDTKEENGGCHEVGVDVYTHH